MISVAIFAAMCASCTSEQVFEEIPVEVSQTSNSVRFDAEEENFEAICRELITVHKDIEICREVLPKNLLLRLDLGQYDLSDMLTAIRFWWENDDIFDFLIEYPTWNEFEKNIPENYINQYGFYW